MRKPCWKVEVGQAAGVTAAPFVLPEWKGNADYLVFDPAHPTQPPVRFFVNIAKAQATADDKLLMGEDEGAISIAFSRQ